MYDLFKKRYEEFMLGILAYVAVFFYIFEKRFSFIIRKAAHK
jgi:hypothetical protein